MQVEEKKYAWDFLSKEIFRFENFTAERILRLSFHILIYAKIVRGKPRPYHISNTIHILALSYYFLTQDYKMKRNQKCDHL